MTDSGSRLAGIQDLLGVLVRPLRAWAIVVPLLAVQSGLLAYSAYVHSPTLNEPAHLAAGISHWQSGEFDLYRVNPPLVRIIAALPVLTVGVKADRHRPYQDPTARADFVVGDDLVAANGERTLFLLMIARWACIPFAWIGGIVCYLWARDLFGARAGVLATTLWCFSPNILAHASLITPDAPATALCAAACYLFWRWLRSPTWEHAILAGIVLGAAELTKTTCIVLNLILPLLWLFYRFADRAESYARRWALEGAMLLACLATGIFTINLGYGFHGAFTELGQYRFVSSVLNGQRPGAVGNRFTDVWLGSLPVPLPKDYVLGGDVQRQDFEHYARPSYLAGEFKDTGWWYYYLYALAIKVPLGIWGLLLLTIALRAANRGQWMRPYTMRDELVVLSPAVVILAIVSCQTGFSEHLRYVLPIAPFLFIWISQIAEGSWPRVSETFVTWRLWRTVLASGLLAWAIGSSLSVYPHSLSYFNELAGGPAGGSAYLLGSNADWGQDLRYLKWWLVEHPEVDSLHLAYCGRCDPACLGFKFTVPPSRIPETRRMPELESGWYAISVNFLRGYPWFAPDGKGGVRNYGRDELSYFSEMRPTAVVGASIYIFHV